MIYKDIFMERTITDCVNDSTEPIVIKLENEECVLEKPALENNDLYLNENEEKYIESLRIKDEKLDSTATCGRRSPQQNKSQFSILEPYVKLVRLEKTDPALFTNFNCIKKEPALKSIHFSSNNNFETYNEKNESVNKLKNVGSLLKCDDELLQLETRQFKTLVPYVKLVRLENIDRTLLKSLEYMKQSGDLCSADNSADVILEDLLEKKSDKKTHLTMYACRTCNTCFTDEQLLARHEYLCKHPFKQVTCKICSKSVMFNCLTHTMSDHLCFKKRIKNRKPNDTKNSIQSDRQSRSVCVICAKAFKSALGLNLHLRRHNGVYPYKCERCKISFKTRVEIVVHCAKHHKTHKNEKYICDNCNNCYPSRAAFLRHMRMKKPKPSLPNLFICDICGRSFKDRKVFKIHINFHTDKRPYPCKYCDKKFTQLPHLRRHERIHTGIKPYSCKECGKGFNDTSNMKVHLLTHSGARPYKCKDCGKSFTQMSHLRTHSVMHMKNRDYICNICNKAFKSKAMLKLHILTHSKYKPYNCDMCGRSFVQQTAFKRHNCSYV